MTRRILICALLWTGAAFAQFGRGGGAWSTTNGDAQRTSWVRTDPQISRENVQKGVVQFLWKLKLDSKPRQLNALTPPAVIGRLITYKGFKDLMFVSGSSDEVYSIDHPLGKIFWEARLPYGSTYPQQKGGTLTCPGGMTAGTVVASFVGAAPAGRGSGGGGRGDPVPPAVPGTPPAGAGRGDAVVPGAGRGGPAFSRSPEAVYALSSDGLFHTLNQHTGTDILPAVKFIRSNAQAHGLIVVNNMAYVATRNNCGGTPNAVWAIDLMAPNKAMSVVKWESGGASIEGSAGFAFGRDGTIYAATGAGPGDPANGQYSATIVALDQKTLQLKDRFSPAGPARSLNFSTTPVSVTYKDKEYIAAGGPEGRLYLLDATGLGGSDHETPLHKSTVYSSAKTGAGALATWEDSDGTRWVLAPAAGPVTPETRFPVTNGEVKNGSIVAFKVVEENGKPSLQPGWVSRDLVSPAPPVVVNGVVFALSTGEYMAPTAAAANAEQRAQRSGPAVLYALDASTGKELWNSGKAIASFSHSGGLAVGGSKIFVSTADSTLYAFGYLLPRD